MNLRFQLFVLFGFCILLSVRFTFAEIYADFETEFGTVTVQLAATNAPRAVANFIGLADGMQTWRDPVTGAVRGGEADPFYADASFDSIWAGYALFGGLRPYTDANESVQWADPGYTLMDEYSAHVPLTRGVLAMPVWEGPHSGSCEFAFILSTNMTTTPYEWTVLGEVMGSGMTVADDIANAVTNEAVSVSISINTNAITPEEESALASAVLPSIAPLPIGFRKIGNSISEIVIESAPQSQPVIAVQSNLLASHWTLLPGAFSTSTNTEIESIPFATLPGQGAGIGFFTGSQTLFPQITMRQFPDKMRLGVQHTGFTGQFWFDFANKTGMLASIENGQPVDSEPIVGLNQMPASANSVVIEYFAGEGLEWWFERYWLGLDTTQSTTGRFYYESWWMNVELDARDWGTFEWVEGWGDE